MPLTKDKKKEICDKVTRIAKENSSLVFVNFHKINVADVTAARRALREKNVGYYVAKKTLIKKSLVDAEIQGEMPELKGEVGIAYSSEPTAAAREVFAFSKKLDDQFKLIGGIFEGKFKNGDEMNEIALIPSLEVLRGKFLNLINSPRQRFAMLLSEKAKKA